MSRPSYMSGKIIKVFMWSHLLGWTLANIQTFWIVWELRKGTEILLHEIKKYKRSTK